jgi:ATP dependent DNA ligase-like protein
MKKGNPLILAILQDTLRPPPSPAGRAWNISPCFRHPVCYRPVQMAFQPMPLSRRALPFDHPEWIFELKYDGFRSLAVIQNGHTQLISRNGHPFNSFSELSKSLAPHSAGKTVLDGEIVCLDKRGRPQFRVTCSFIVASPASTPLIS